MLAPLLLGALDGAAGFAADTNGPTIFLRYGNGKTAANPVAEFMYFVPLISPAPVASLVSPNGAQVVHLISMERHASGNSFTANCEMEVDGTGWQRSIFDLSPAIRRHEDRLQKGDSLKHQLKSINVEGAGSLNVEVKGTMTNNVPTINEVRMHFNARGRTSPVWIHLCDILRVDGNNQPTNEIQARVNTLTFRRQTGTPKMEVTIAAIKPMGAGNGFWQNFKGAIEGVTANIFLEPLKIEAVGDQAMLDFGQALVSGAPSFTFPRAKNMEAHPVDEEENKISASASLQSNR